MNPQIIHLEIQCTTCKGHNYFEDESGYYACSDCNTISQIRCGLELDYTFPIRTIKSKVKNEDDDNFSDDGGINDINDIDGFSQKYSFDTENMNNISTTNIKSIKSSRIETSSLFDITSIYSKSIKRKQTIQIKTTEEILVEIQTYFENIMNVIINDFFEKKDKNSKKSSNCYFEKNLNFGEIEKKIFYDKARRIWMYFIAKKYKNISNPFKKKELIRSRKNSLEEEKEKEGKKNRENENEEKNNIINNNNNNGGHGKNKIIKIKKIKRKKIKLHDEIKMRRITERNVYNLYNDNNNLLNNFSFKECKSNKKNNKNNFYTEINFNPDNHNKICLQKFIEEYDQVINFIKKDKCFDIIFQTEEEKEKINITNVID